jgi:hypothetical protein
LIDKKYFTTSKSFYTVYINSGYIYSCQHLFLGMLAGLSRSEDRRENAGLSFGVVETPAY